jgi:hypothetical protein
VTQTAVRDELTYTSNKRAAETKAKPEDAAASIRAAFNAVNENFYFVGFSGSPFN